MVLKIFWKWQLNLRSWKTWRGHGKSWNNMKMSDCSSLMVKRLLVRSRLISVYEVLYFSLTFWLHFCAIGCFFFHASKKLPTASPLYVHFKQLSFKAGIYSLIFLLQEGLEEFEEVTNPKGIVLNPETNEDVDMGEWRTSHFGHLTVLPYFVDCAFLSTSL